MRWQRRERKQMAARKRIRKHGQSLVKIVEYIRRKALAKDSTKQPE